MLGKPHRIVLNVLVCLAITGCGRTGPLTFGMHRTPFAPWCAANRRVKIGQRAVGRVHDGAKYKDFLVDDKEKEYDPEDIADRAWSYLERTGDARRIQDALGKDSCPTSMSIVSINPVIVILSTYHDPAWQKQNREFAYKRWAWPAQIQPNSDPPFREGLQWFSPDLKQGPIDLAFSEKGVADIQLPEGKLKLIRQGDKCSTRRE
jgi:hypothetical protein